MPSEIQVGARVLVSRMPGHACQNPAMADEKPTDWGSWAANDEQQLTFGLRATPAQRLAWLEEIIVLAYRSGALPRTR